MFRSGWTIFHVRGVPIRLHVSLLRGVPVRAWWLGTRGTSPAIEAMGQGGAELLLPGPVFGLLLVGAIFLSIIAHELGHALVAMSQGAEVRAITLMLLGGVSDIVHPLATPAQRFWVAVAGPVVNAALAALSFSAFRAPWLPVDASLLLLWFGLFNLFIAGFNLLPAFPLDGGRILRALLESRINAERATRIAARVGRVLAVSGAIFALLNGLPGLLVVSVFVYLGAGLEELGLDIRERLAGLKVGAALLTDVATVGPDEEVRAAREHVRARGAAAALVRDLRGLYGVVTADALTRGRGLVRDLIEGVSERVRVDDDLQAAFDQLRLAGAPLVVVDDSNAVVGVVTGASAAAAAARGAGPAV